MYLLFQDLTPSNDNAQYIFCRLTTPVTYQWRYDFTSIDRITTPHTDDGSHQPYLRLQGLLDFYRDRDDANFKLLARGKTIQRMFERYPELLI